MQLEIIPIEAAPIRPNERFGPCLLLGQNVDVGGELNEGERWAVGRWNGQEWAVGGVVFVPTHYALLPRGFVTNLVGPEDVLRRVCDEINHYAYERVRSLIEKPTGGGV